MQTYMFRPLDEKGVLHVIRFYADQKRSCSTIKTSGNGGLK
jgi:hypothetical protein